MLQLLQTGEAIQSLEAEWRALERTAASPLLFQSFDWVLPWFETFAPTDAARVAVLRERGRLRALAPLVVGAGRLGPFRTRALALPHNAHSTRNGVLCAVGDENAAADLVEALVAFPGAWDVIELRDLSEESPVVHAIASRLEAAGAAAEWLPSRMRTPVLERRGTWQEFHDSRSRNFRRNLRRAREKLDQFGEIDIRTCATPPEIAEGVAILGAIERAGWKGAAGTAIGDDAVLAAFYTTVAQRFGAAGALDLSVLTLGRQPAAACLAIRYAGIVYGLKVSYDPAFAEGSPGLWLACAMFERQWTPTTRAFDLLEESGFPSDRLTDQFDRRLMLRIFRNRPYARLLGTLKLGFGRRRSAAGTWQ